MQSAALFGLYALNILAVATFAAPAALALPRSASGDAIWRCRAWQCSRWRRFGLYGALRLSQASAAFVPDVSAMNRAAGARSAAEMGIPRTRIRCSAHIIS